MFTIYDYRWYVEGKYLALLQFNDDSMFTTPENAQTNAILVRYTKAKTVPTLETTDLGISGDLGTAVTHYVKYKMLEDTQDERQRQWHWNKFLYYVQLHNKNLKGDSFSVKPMGPGVLK